MALKNLQSLVLPVVASATDKVTGMDGKSSGMRGFTAFLSYPRHHLPSCPNLARNPRGTILSRWSRPMEESATISPDLSQARVPAGTCGTAFVQG